MRAMQDRIRNTAIGFRNNMKQKPLRLEMCYCIARVIYTHISTGTGEKGSPPLFQKKVYIKILVAVEKTYTIVYYIIAIKYFMVHTSNNRVIFIYYNNPKSLGDTLFHSPVEISIHITNRYFMLLTYMISAEFQSKPLPHDDVSWLKFVAENALYNLTTNVNLTKTTNDYATNSHENIGQIGRIGLGHENVWGLKDKIDAIKTIVSRLDGDGDGADEEAVYDALWEAGIKQKDAEYLLSDKLTERGDLIVIEKPGNDSRAYTMGGPS